VAVTEGRTNVVGGRRSWARKEVRSVATKKKATKKGKKKK
jgi:hypothetical protein